MQRRHIRMSLEFTAADDVNTAEISNLLGYKNTNLRHVLKKHTQAL